MIAKAPHPKTRVYNYEREIEATRLEEIHGLNVKLRKLPLASHPEKFTYRPINSYSEPK